MFSANVITTLFNFVSYAFIQDKERETIVHDLLNEIVTAVREHEDVIVHHSKVQVVDTSADMCIMM